MAEFRKDPGKKGDPTARSLRELMELLLKLNSKIRGKISPRPSKEEKAPGNAEMVIIILNQSSENPPKTSRREKPPTRGDDWIDGLCEEIQKEGRRGRKPT
jgi:hypothetical protein